MLADRLNDLWTVLTGWHQGEKPESAQKGLGEKEQGANKSLALLKNVRPPLF
jgi:hypothetical protein